MSCNLPIVATDVGDIKFLLGNLDGHFLSSFDSNILADNIKLGLEYSEHIGRTKGRERIMALCLDSESVAKKIIIIYERVLGKGKKLKKIK